MLTRLLDKKCFCFVICVSGRSGVVAHDMEMKSEITSVL